MFWTKQKGWVWQIEPSALKERKKEHKFFCEEWSEANRIIFPGAGSPLEESQAGILSVPEACLFSWRMQKTTVTTSDFIFAKRLRVKILKSLKRVIFDYDPCQCDILWCLNGVRILECKLFQIQNFLFSVDLRQFLSSQFYQVKIHCSQKSLVHASLQIPWHQIALFGKSEGNLMKKSEAQMATTVPACFLCWQSLTKTRKRNEDQRTCHQFSSILKHPTTAEKNEKVNLNNDISFERKKGHLRFQLVTLMYPDKCSLFANLSFTFLKWLPCWYRCKVDLEGKSHRFGHFHC